MKKLILGLVLPAALSTGTAVYADDHEDDGDLVRMCHKGKETIMVGEGAAWAHAINHGDERGYCPGDEPPERPKVGAVVMMRCDNNDAGEIIVDAISVAHGGDVVNPLDEMGDGYNCAQALRRLGNAGFEVKTKSVGGGGSGLRVEYVLSR